jgi:hypothetical protein
MLIFRSLGNHTHSKKFPKLPHQKVGETANTWTGVCFYVCITLLG